MKKYKLIIICIAVILLVTAVLVLAIGNSKANNGEDDFIADEENSTEAEGNDDDNTPVAKIEDTIITKESFDDYKALWKDADTVPSDSELLDRIIKDEVVYITALKEGVTVSDEELENALQAEKNGYSSDEKTKNATDALCESRNITVDQYWERLKPGIKKAMIRGKYKEKMKEEYKEEFMSDDIDYTDFDKYYEDKISDLMKKMKIKKYID